MVVQAVPNGFDLEAASSGVQSPKDSERKKGLVKRPFHEVK